MRIIFLKHYESPSGLSLSIDNHTNATLLSKDKWFSNSFSMTSWIVPYHVMQNAAFAAATEASRSIFCCFLAANAALPEALADDCGTTTAVEPVAVCEALVLRLAAVCGIAKRAGCLDCCCVAVAVAVVVVIVVVAAAATAAAGAAAVVLLLLLLVKFKWCD
uniref:Uncharacterized protein n=1 Tax=Glossina pallidipes TaxID=7398 RepID=A0A1B0ADM5_GLOPL